MLSQIKAKCHQEISKFNKNGNGADSDEHFNYKNYILQQKDLLSKIYQQQKKLKKFSQSKRTTTDADNASSMVTSKNETKKSSPLVTDSSNSSSSATAAAASYSANLLLNSLQIEHLKKSSNSLKPYSPNFSKKKILILNQLVIFILNSLNLLF